MTPLDQLVRVRNLMQCMDLDSKLQRAYKDFESSMDPVRETEVYETLLTPIALAKDALDNYKSQYQHAIDSINHLIQQQVPVTLEKSRQIDQASTNDNDLAIMQRKLQISEEDQTWFAHRLHVLSSWKTPALFLRPSTLWINDLVSNDPLYLVDRSYELIRPCQRDYHEVYRRRLREYIINESEEKFLTKELPLNQFGLVFAWNYFEMRSVDALARYVKEVAQLLRPSGHFVFTYNNCDHENGIRLIDHHSGTYIDFALVKDIAEKNGLQVSQYRSQSNIAWVELKQPGEFASLRGGQSLAKIIEESK